MTKIYRKKICTNIGKGFNCANCGKNLDGRTHQLLGNKTHYGWICITCGSNKDLTIEKIVDKLNV